MNGDDVEIVASPVVADGHVERSVGLNRCHHQTLRVGPGTGSLLDNLPGLNGPKGLLSGDPSLVSSEQRVVAPLDAPGLRGCANGVESKHHTTEVCAKYRNARRSGQCLAGSLLA